MHLALYPARLSITAATRQEADEKLNEPVGKLQQLARKDRSRGILVTKVGSGRFTVELSHDVLYGLTEEAVLQESGR